MDDYEHILDSALEELPEDASEQSGERFQIPELHSLIQGKQTIWQNLQAIARIMDRPEKDVVKYFASRLGTAGRLSDGRGIFNGQFGIQQLSEILILYIKNYVTCPNCGRPDTTITKDKHGYTLTCSACGE